jgi:arginine decarboxylase
MNELSQSNAPVYEALLRHRNNRVVPFDVPGHKQGRGNPDLTEFLGKDCMASDVNSMRPLDNLSHPVSVIRQAHKLAAEAFRAQHAMFMVNGTTGAVQAMMMSVCKTDEKIILPRNVHRSAINALVISGAVPVYVSPGIDRRLGIPLGMSIEAVREAMDFNPDAKAILVNNPTYYGICGPLETIVAMAHERGMKVLVDEAHGTHFYFGEDLPVAAMHAGADMAAVSMHKTGGSLTQSSILLLGENVNADYVRQVINLTQTTSASYLLLSSLDVSRRNLALNGKEIFDKVKTLAQYAREEINRIGGWDAFSEELINKRDVFDFDTTKLAVYTRSLGLAGIEVYDILRDRYNIQIEFGDLGNILAIISVGDRPLEIERLVSALAEIKRLHAKDPTGMFDHEYITPEVVLKPKTAFYARKIQVLLADSIHGISGEFVMAYPPGIPILAPGERVTREIIDYINYSKEKGCSLTGTEDLRVERINILEDL